eukprot:2575996-Rhodomonas_salina.6
MSGLKFLHGDESNAMCVVTVTTSKRNLKACSESAARRGPGRVLVGRTGTWSVGELGGACRLPPPAPSCQPISINLPPSCRPAPLNLKNCSHVGEGAYMRGDERDVVLAARERERVSERERTNAHVRYIDCGLQARNGAVTNAPHVAQGTVQRSQGRGGSGERVPAGREGAGLVVVAAPVLGGEGLVVDVVDPALISPHLHCAPHLSSRRQPQLLREHSPLPLLCLHVWPPAPSTLRSAHGRWC